LVVKARRVGVVRERQRERREREEREKRERRGEKQEREKGGTNLEALESKLSFSVLAAFKPQRLSLLECCSALGCSAFASLFLVVVIVVIVIGRRGRSFVFFAASVSATAVAAVVVVVAADGSTQSRTANICPLRHPRRQRCSSPSAARRPETGSRRSVRGRRGRRRRRRGGTVLRLIVMPLPRLQLLWKPPAPAAQTRAL